MGANLGAADEVRYVTSSRDETSERWFDLEGDADADGPEGLTELADEDRWHGSRVAVVDRHDFDLSCRVRAGGVQHVKACIETALAVERDGTAPTAPVSDEEGLQSPCIRAVDHRERLGRAPTG
ncbi:MAG: hypothetical protein U1F36_09325 [Planctomycetota bacterium]